MIHYGLLHDMHTVARHESCRGACIVWQVGNRQKFRISSFSVSFQLAFFHRGVLKWRASTSKQTVQLPKVLILLDTEMAQFSWNIERLCSNVMSDCL